MITGFAHNTLAPDQRTEFCNNAATQKKCFALLISYVTTSRSYGHTMEELLYIGTAALPLYIGTAALPLYGHSSKSKLENSYI